MDMKLQDYLDQYTKPGQLVESLDEQAVRCQACAHGCQLEPGQRGICKIRFNQDGVLQTPWGYVSSLQVDPIEKKPFYHFLAGSNALTFGMLGCNLQCDYCQNWLTSQALREKDTDHLKGYLQTLQPADILDQGIRHDARVMASSYNEPLITTEWAVDIFRLSSSAGLKNVYISNGYATKEALDYLQPFLQGFKVDLKTMQPDHYRQLGGALQAVLDSIAYAVELGMWVEVVTLLVPGFNDSESELQDMASFIRSISPEMPWHITAFRPEFRMRDRPRTSARQILKAVELGYQAGLQYVYGGNLPGSLGKYAHTSCHQCQTVLIKRWGFSIQQYRITTDGKCPDCGTTIPGCWG
jgi:pyruvate formate lyase activating enzyme